MDTRFNSRDKDGVHTPGMDKPRRYSSLKNRPQDAACPESELRYTEVEGDGDQEAPLVSGSIYAGCPRCDGVVGCRRLWPYSKAAACIGDAVVDTRWRLSLTTCLFAIGVDMEDAKRRLE